MKKQLKLCAAIAATLLFCANTNAQIVINEYSSATSTFLDDYSEESDWIELYNTSAAEVDLNGWHLSDSKENLAKWTFPSVKIAANGYLLVMASGKDVTTVADGKYPYIFFFFIVHFLHSVNIIICNPFINIKDVKRRKFI